MLKKMLLAAVTLGFSTAVLADPPRWAPAHGWRDHHGRYEHDDHDYYEHYRPRYYAYAPRPVYVVPAPRIVYAPPPAPVVYAPAPVYRPAPAYVEPSLSIRFDFPL